MGHDPGSVRGGVVPAERRTRVGRHAAPRDFQVVVRTLRAKEGGQEGAQPIVKEYWDVQPVGEWEEAEEEEERVGQGEGEMRERMRIMWTKRKRGTIDQTSDI